MTWQLRRADAADLDAIMALETATFGTDAWSPASMRAELSGPGRYYLVAFPYDAPARIVAYAGLLAPDGSHQADVQTIAVAPSARRHGLGRTLMLSLMAEARRRGAGEMFLEVRADNPGATGLYDELGFVQIDVRRGYYQPDGVDAIVMRAPLAAPVAAPAATPPPRSTA